MDMYGQQSHGHMEKRECAGSWLCNQGELESPFSNFDIPGNRVTRVIMQASCLCSA